MVTTTGTERHVRRAPEGGWEIKSPGGGRISARFATKRQAVTRATEIIRNKGGGLLVIFDASGIEQQARDIPGTGRPHPAAASAAPNAATEKGQTARPDPPSAGAARRAQKIRESLPTSTDSSTDSEVRSMTDTQSSGGMMAAGQEVAGTAVDKAGEVSQQATEQAKAVAGTAVEQALQVSGAAASQARDLLDQTRQSARRQADTQLQQIAEALGRLSDQGRALVAGRQEEAGSLPDLAEQAIAKLDQLGVRLRDGGIDAVSGEIRRLGRQRPALFLTGAAALGLGVGRLLRAGALQSTPGQAPAVTDATQLDAISPPALPYQSPWASEQAP